MRRLGEDMFPKERFELERVYVNNAVYGDVYYAHRDCDPKLANVTVLHYGNVTWHSDWGGETLFYDDQHDVELAVTPRPGRFVVSRGASTPRWSSFAHLPRGASDNCLQAGRALNRYHAGTEIDPAHSS